MVVILISVAPMKAATCMYNRVNIAHISFPRHGTRFRFFNCFLLMSRIQNRSASHGAILQVVDNKHVPATGLVGGESRDSERDRPGREEKVRNGRFPGLPSPVASGAGRTAGIAERLLAVGPNETARRGVLTGRDRSESVSIRYAHWRRCNWQRTVYIFAWPATPDAGSRQEA